MTNKTIMTGNIATDIEVRPVGESQVAKFNLAVKDDFKKDKTYFFPVEAWGKTAELLNTYCGKGSKILIEAQAQMDEWEQDGQKRSKVKFNAAKIEFLTPKGQSNTNTQPQQNNTATPPQNANSNNPFGNATGSIDIDNSELPF
ncbi:single-stranded DNA-binding protein [Macrococcoides goetzii]|nr:single-stranded DNA-binding protein [Macrococcus goetzii]TDM48243.1 single-stranded DNA-binding protein [Macrococcus goetzii]